MAEKLRSPIVDGIVLTAVAAVAVTAVIGAKTYGNHKDKVTPYSLSNFRDGYYDFNGSKVVCDGSAGDYYGKGDERLTTFDGRDRSYLITQTGDTMSDLTKRYVQRDTTHPVSLVAATYAVSAYNHLPDAANLPVDTTLRLPASCYYK